MAKLSPFDYIKFINQTVKEPDNIMEEIAQSYSQFMINRILSSSPEMLKFCLQANKIKVSDETHYKMVKQAYKEKFSKQAFDEDGKPSGVSCKKVYFTYVKKNTIPKDVEAVCQYFQVNAKLAVDYLELLEEDELVKIRKFYEYWSKSQ